MPENKEKKLTRRTFLKGTALGVFSLPIPFGSTDANVWEAFLQRHFLEMKPDELEQVVKRLEKEYEEKYGVKFNIKTTESLDNVLFGYGLDLSRCIGCRRCVYACVRENNQCRDDQKHWITVLRFERGRKGVTNLEEATKYYDPEKVPEEDAVYMPVQCQQCEHPPCVKSCPTQATWKEPDGIVVIDYNWCIGCRYCMAACPYGARRFNWAEPFIPKEEINTNSHYLGNRIRYRGVVEKCTFCIQRTRDDQNPDNEMSGRYPACVEICPVGARKFGNLLDPESEISYIIKHQRVFRLKEELNTKPQFFYFFSL